MRNTILGLLGVFALFAAIPVSAGDVPRGFMGIDELAAAQAKAKEANKLVVVVAKGSDDACPHCVATMEIGIKATRGDAIMVFTRVADLRSNAAAPAKLKEISATAADGASVYFYAFNSDMTELIASAGRELETDKEALKEFKKLIDEARKKLK
jgi:hypothetical protein